MTTGWHKKWEMKRYSITEEDDNNDNSRTMTMDFTMNDISCFGVETVRELTKFGNPTFTRGAFGEISIAIRQRRQERSHGENNKDNHQIDIDDNDDNQGRCCFFWEFVAIKTIERTITTDHRGNQQLSKDILNELCALKVLSNHRNVVPLLATFLPSETATGQWSSKNALALVFPYSPIDLNMSLEWRRRNFLPDLPFSIIKLIARDLFSALLHCHSSGILHRDIKPGNLLVSSSGVIQLCDFGLAKPFKNSNNDDDDHDHQTLPTVSAKGSGTKGLCTLYYRPPEVLLGGPASAPSVDMYSAGLVIVELVTGKPLFPGSNVLEQLSLIFDYLGTPTDTSWPNVKELPDYRKLTFVTKVAKSWLEIVPKVIESQYLTDLLSKLITLDPNTRSSAHSSLQHEWLSSSLSSSSDTKFASYVQLRNELIPPSLEEPFLLTSLQNDDDNDNDDDGEKIVSKLALQIASNRRTFLTTQVSWKAPE